MREDAAGGPFAGRGHLHPAPLKRPDFVGPPSPACGRRSAVQAARAQPLVEIAGVSKTFAASSGAIRALDDVSLDIAANAFFTLLGPSGCGKTTLLRLIAGFEHSDRGTLKLGDRDVTGDPPNRRPVNIVFQSYALFPHMSVGENVGFGLARLGLPRKRIAERVAAMLALVQLDGMAGRKPAQLSGGQQQRVALARALAPNPKVLLLDEPLSALDLKLRRAMQVELKRIQRETGITFLLVTHDQEEALSMSDRIAVMNAGHIEQIGAPHAVYDAPRTRFVADFFGANILPGALVGSPVAHVAVRPERVEIAVDGPGLPGRVTEATYLGATTALVVALDCGEVLKVECHGGTEHAVGSIVRCRLSQAALMPLET